MDKKELQKLEDEHNRKLRDLERLEIDLDNYYKRFNRVYSTLLKLLQIVPRYQQGAWREKNLRASQS